MSIEAQGRTSSQRERCWQHRNRCGGASAVLCICLSGVSLARAQDVGAAAADNVETVTPPQPIERVAAQYPASALAARLQTTVELSVVVGVDGLAAAVEVLSSGGGDFDAAAVEAVRRWRFAPARRGQQPVASRIRVALSFAPPPASTPPVPPPATELSTETVTPPAAAPVAAVVGSAAAPVAVTATADADEAPIDVTVRGERSSGTESRAASDFRVERDVLAAAPRQEGIEVLRTAPGLYLGRGEGPAVAPQYSLRGFDAGHGQDIEFRVGGLPINLPSHIHGQGYADLSFLIADSVQELRVTEGVYDPRQGDFAVAGSIQVGLGVAAGERGVRLRSSYGAFNTFRQLALWAPRGAPEESFGAVQYSRTDGFGQNRAGQSGSGVFQHRFGSGSFKYRAIGIVHAARSDFAGVLRVDDIDSGRVCFQCVYPYPTAQAQNALSQRFIAGFFADYASKKGASGQLGVWLGYDNFRLLENFTGFLQSSTTLERVAGRGDLIELQNRTQSYGLTGRYRTAPFRPATWANGTLEVGSDVRLDVIDQGQNLVDASVRNQTWDRRVDAGVRAMDLGTWGDLDWHFTRYFRARLGLRADLLSYDVDDRLGNFAPLVRPKDTYIVGFRRSAMGLAWGPRASVEVKPLEWLSVLAAYGEGYRSPQARTLEEGEKTPFAKVRSVDFGLRFDLGKPLLLTVGGYYTHLSDDVAFEAAEGRLERIGATQRLGAVLQAQSRPWSWAVASLSLTYVDATLLQPPPATAEEPQPPFQKGQSLPYVAPIVVRADLGAHHTFVADLGGEALRGRAGLGFSLLSPRPLPYGEFADPVALLDASAALLWGIVDLRCELFNALNNRYAALEYNFPSDWNPGAPRSRTPARHIAAGAPLAWMVSLGVTL